MTAIELITGIITILKPLDNKTAPDKRKGFELHPATQPYKGLGGNQTAG